MKNEFVLAFNEVIEDKQLPKEVIQEALEAAMVSAYRRAVNASNAQHVEATLDPETGIVTIFAEKEIVDDIQDSRTEVSLADALKLNEEAQIGDMLVVETTPKNFGRVAAQTARQVIQQRIREAERDAQIEHFGKQVGEILSGVVQAINSQVITLGLDMKAEGIMPRNHQVHGERFRVHDRVRALLLEVKTTPRGPQIILSRAHRNFLRRLLENEVPEIYHGMVEIRSIAREPGHRSKVAVAALQPGVDPVGACVGIRGVRIQAIVRELNDEKIDVIEWNTDAAIYIAKALSPARVSGVYLNEHSKGTKTATVVVPEDQLSLAIGRDGQNARLAAKLTGWRIDIKGLLEAAADAIYKLQNDPEYAEIAEEETDTIPLVEAIMAKKAEGRPIMPEEYQTLNQFVDRVERGLIRKLLKTRQIEEERQRVAQANVPDGAYQITLEDMAISPRMTTILGGAGYTTAGDLMLQMILDSDEILALNGIGPKAMADIEKAIANLEFEEEIPEIEEPVAEEESQVVEDEEIVAEVELVAETEVIEEAEAIEVEAPVDEETIEVVQVGVEAEEGDLKTEEEEPKLVGIPELEEVKQDASLEEIFALRPDVLEYSGDDIDEEEEDDETDRKRKKKRKKKKYIQAEYDPEQDVVLYTRKRKRGGGGEWDEDQWDV